MSQAPVTGSAAERILALTCSVPDAVFTHDRSNAPAAYQRGFHDALRAAAEVARGALGVREDGK